jgi:hypothetical protein
MPSQICHLPYYDISHGFSRDFFQMPYLCRYSYDAGIKKNKSKGQDNEL